MYNILIVKLNFNMNRMEKMGWVSLVELHKYVLSRIHEEIGGNISISKKTISRLFPPPNKGHLASKRYLNRLNVKLYHQLNTLT